MFTIDFSKVDMVYAAEAYLDSPLQYHIAEESLLLDDEIAMEGIGSAVKSFFSWIAAKIRKLIEMIKKHIIEPLNKFFSRKKTGGSTSSDKPDNSQASGGDDSPKFQKLLNGGSQATKQMASSGQKLLGAGNTIKIASKLAPKFQNFIGSSTALSMAVLQNSKYITSRDPKDGAVFGNMIERTLGAQLDKVRKLQGDFLGARTELENDRDIEIQEAAVHKIQAMFNELIPLMTKFQSMLSNTNIASQNTNQYYPLEDRVTYFMRDFLFMLNFQITITNMLISGQLTHERAIRDAVLDDWSARFSRENRKNYH